MTFSGGMAKHWLGSPVQPTLSGLEAQLGSQTPINIEKPKMRSMSENRAQSVAQAGVIQMNGSSDHLKQLFLDNARMWDCLCLMKSDPALQCEFAIRVIFSLDDFQFLASPQDADGSELSKHNLLNTSSNVIESHDVEEEKQRLAIENSRLHAILWVLRDNPNLQVDSTVAAIFRMTDAQVHDKFGTGCNYSPGCLSLLMKVGSKWKPVSSRRSSTPDQTVSQLLRNNRSHSTSSREFRSQIKRLSGVKQLWSWSARQMNSTSNWKATVSDDREPKGKSVKGNSTIWLMPVVQSFYDFNGKYMNNSDLETPQESDGLDTSLSSNYSLSQNKYYNTNMNRQLLFPSRNRRLSSLSLSNVAKISSPPSSPPVNLGRFHKRHSLTSLPADDFYVQHDAALRRSLKDCRNMASCSAGMRMKPGTTGGAKQETRKSQEQIKETTPKISFTAAPAHIAPRGKQYPLPPYPTPRYFIEKHKNTKTGWDHPYKSNLIFRFTRQLHEPKLLTHHTMLGPTDARNDVIKQCNT